MPVQAARTASGVPETAAVSRGWLAAWSERLTDRNLHLLVIFGVLLIYLPFCGSYGFWDPWEGHYAEVARQMRIRGDWISLWWPGSPMDRAEFWSKPVFTFWVEAIFFKIFHVASPSAPLGQVALSSATEWACRVPMALFGTLGVWSVFYATSRLVSRRAGVLAALVCATAPMYFFISRQAITDMPFVGPMTAALCLGALALIDEDAELPRRKTWKIDHPHSAMFYVFIAGFLILTVPQLVVDSIDLRMVMPWFGARKLVTPGIVPMVPYILLWAWFLWRMVHATKRSQIQLNIAYMLCGVAALAKGLVGIGLPGLVLVAFLAASWDWKQLKRLDIVSGIINVVVVAFPWYHAMLIRHGVPFWNELMGDNHWRRLAIGRHGDNQGKFNYYIRELGYALFPWTAVATVAMPAAVVRARPTSPRGKFLLFVGLWAVLAYALVSASMTKFHHYILPAVPAIAIICGWFLEELLAGDIPAQTATVALALLGLPLLGMVTWDLTQSIQAPQRLLWLFDYDYINNPRGRTWPEQFDYRGWIIAFAALAAIATALVAWPKIRRYAAVGLCAIAIGFTYFGIDKMLIDLSPHWSQKHLLQTYYKLKQPGDRIVAWQMYWRGETFYTENELYDPKLPREEKSVFCFERNVENLQEWLKKHQGVHTYFVIEKARVESLRSLMPYPQGKQTLKVVDETNNKFVLAVATI